VIVLKASFKSAIEIFVLRGRVNMPAKWGGESGSGEWAAV
jgi:hypothetical protein